MTSSDTQIESQLLVQQKESWRQTLATQVDGGQALKYIPLPLVLQKSQSQRLLHPFTAVSAATQPAAVQEDLQQLAFRAAQMNATHDRSQLAFSAGPAAHAECEQAGQTIVLAVSAADVVGARLVTLSVTLSAVLSATPWPALWPALSAALWPTASPPGGGTCSSS